MALQATVKRFTDLAAESAGSSPAEQDATACRQAAQFRPIIMTIKLEQLLRTGTC